jgi:hypothetical protein
MLAFKGIAGKLTFDRIQVLGELLQSKGVCTHDTAIGVNDKYGAWQGVQEIRERLADPAHESRKADGAYAVADECWIVRGRYHAAQVPTAIEADLFHLHHISSRSANK